jgi:SAM-dependent methyltransferase
MLPNDYDSDPGRFLSADQPSRTDVHPYVADRFAQAGARTVLDVGGGNGRLARLLPALGIRCLLIDLSPTMLDLAPRPCTRADGARLPVADDSVDAVALLYTLYHYADPLIPIREARRVLKPGGLLAACAANRDTHPELACLRDEKPLSRTNRDFARPRAIIVTRSNDTPMRFISFAPLCDKITNKAQAGRSRCGNAHLTTGGVMSVYSIFYNGGRDVLADRGPDARPVSDPGGRLTRLAPLDPDRLAESLVFLAGFAPAVFDSILNATEPCLDDELPPDEDALEPFCATCAACVGIFVSRGSEWLHYTGDPVNGDVEPYETDHAPVIAWRPAAGPAVVAL